MIRSIHTNWSHAHGPLGVEPSVSGRIVSVDVTRQAVAGETDREETFLMDAVEHRVSGSARLEIQASADSGVIVIKPHNERELRARFPDAFAEYDKVKGASAKTVSSADVAGGTDDDGNHDGTPAEKADLSIMDFIHVPEAKRQFLVSQGITTVGELAHASDFVIGTLGRWASTWRDKANAYIGE